MKRRNTDAIKPRRPPKRASKFTEGVYGSSFVYLKFVLIWCLVLLADFILEFRFEYLWPFWLLLRSVCDSFKYQGLALSVFFVCIAITSDMVCLLFIPVQWLFFLASTYVWVQYIWHTDRGICLPTISLWILFMYIEATIRLKDLKNSFHVDLCRPFAAHCIGYPVVTLGFGFKSYVQYRLRLQTQREVQKDNEFYFELLRSALPVEQQQNCSLPSPEKNSIKSVEQTSNGVISHNSHNHNTKNSSKKDKIHSGQKPIVSHDSNSTNRIQQSSSNESSPGSRNTPQTNKSNNSSFMGLPGNDQTILSGKKLSNQHNNNLLNGYDDRMIITPPANEITSPSEVRKRNSSVTPTISSTNSKKTSLPNIVILNKDGNDPSSKTPSRSSSTSSRGSGSPKSNKQSNNRDTAPNVKRETSSPKEFINDECNKTCTKTNNDASRIEELESCVLQLRSELNSTRQCEGDLRMKNYTLLHDERSAKNELAQLRRDNDQLQTKLHNLVNNKQKDKQILQNMEKRIKAETEIREAVERVLQEERKKRKEEEEMTTRAVAIATSEKVKENAEIHKRNLDELEKEFEKAKKILQEKEELCKMLENKILELQQNEKSAKETETLMSALAAMKEKNLMLEKSLSAETRLKLDLFSALGDVKRQLDMAHTIIFKREVEINELKSRVADVLSVLPESQIRSSTPLYSNAFVDNQQPQQSIPISPTQHYSAGFCPIPVATSPLSPNSMDQHHVIHPNTVIAPGVVPVSLDPNAAMYTPPASGM